MSDIISIISGYTSLFSTIGGIGLSLIGGIFVAIKRLKNKKEICEEEKIGWSMIFISLVLLGIGLMTSLIFQIHNGLPIR